MQYKIIKSVATKYLTRLRRNGHRSFGANDVRDAFIDGAEWQFKKIQPILEGLIKAFYSGGTLDDIELVVRQAQQILNDEIGK